MSYSHEVQFHEILQGQDAVSGGLKGKKPYSPPQPDANTFETQEEFFNSLMAIPISSVEPHNRRCPHCWKYYGESDPGADNAEEPVKFLCGHVFGKQCMHDVFRLPRLAKVELHPMSFRPGSRGAKLGARLDKFLAPKGEEDATADNTAIKNRLIHVISSIEKPDGDILVGDILGPEWLSLIQQIVFSNHQVLKVHLLENGVVYDINGTELTTSALQYPIGYFPPLYPPADIGSTIYSYGVDEEIQTMILQHLKDHGPDPKLDFHALLYGIDNQWETTSSTPSASSAPPMLSSISPKSFPHLPDPNSSAKLPPKASPDSASSKLPPKASPDSTFSKPSSSLPTPGSLPSVSPMTHGNSVSKVSALPSAAASHTAVIGWTTSGIPPVEDFESYLSFQGASPAPKAPSNKSTAGVYQAAIIYLKSKNPNAPPLGSLEELTKKANEAFKEKSVAYKKKADAEKKRVAQAQDERAVRRKAKIDIIAAALTKVVGQYRKSQPGPPRSTSPSSPPSKKLKANSFVASNSHHTIHAVATLHQHEVGSAHYEVPQPYDGRTEGYSSEADSDNEVDSIESDGEDDYDDEKYAQCMVILVRTLCTARKCCFDGEEARNKVRLQLGGPPETIGWKDIKSSPDCCPLCKKILFKKAGGRKANKWQSS
ncbi:hypothetical protein K505DRAFT_419764 [Melanomma pulvis-pyrius CBS 109.77]|uniref:RING-type domain-containing protein n=1 Tax=Melanomma pulvis-pyrius CBS 109.77 TaxID=1314802 RepID=A0A6A6X2G5_9PLEO|nr:hypothetical protein K505DRAFT_419764 [Melanomma pulvis-pyrius CBS 109.77]